jgi:membrane-associated progesterone receptor component
MDGGKGENLKFFSIQELAKHDGSNESLPLLLSVQGMVFDVSESRGFYGPGVSTLS